MSIFKKKPIEAAPVDPLAALLQGIDGAFRSTVTAASPRTTLQSGDAEACRTWLSSAREAILTAAVHITDTQPSAGFFVPAVCLKTTDGDMAATLETFCAAWAANLPRNNRQIAIYSMSHEPAKTDEELWPFLEMEAYQLKLAGQQAWLFIDTSLREALQAKTAAAPVPASQAKDHTPIAISRPRDFPVLTAFLPQTLSFGNYRFSLEAESVGFGTCPQDAGFWYLTGFDLAGVNGEKPLRVASLCAIPENTPVPTGLEKEAFANAASTALFKERINPFAVLSKKIPSNPGIKKLSSAPDLSASGDFLIFRAALVGHSVIIPFLLATPTAGLAPLFEQWLTTREIARFSTKKEARILLLNMKILMSRLGENLAPPDLRKKAPQMLVAELLNHLGETDYTLVLQNCLINTLGAKGLPSLFYYNETVALEDGSTREKILPVGPLDTKRLFPHMQEIFRNEYIAQCSQLHEHPLEACISRNTETMKGIAVTLRYKRIASTPRLLWLVKEYFLRVTRTRLEAELKDLKASGFPFAALKALKPVLAQKALTKLEDKDAALVLLDSPEEKDNLKPFMSSVRIVRIQEEMVFQRRMYDDWEIGPEEVMAAKHLLADACAKLLDIDESMPTTPLR